MEDLFFSENIFIIWETSSGNMNSMRKKLASIQMDNNSTISTSDKTIYMKINSSPYSVINNSNLKIFSAPEKNIYCLRIFVCAYFQVLYLHV